MAPFARNTRSMPSSVDQASFRIQDEANSSHSLDAYSQADNHADSIGVVFKALGVHEVVTKIPVRLCMVGCPVILPTRMKRYRCQGLGEFFGLQNQVKSYPGTSPLGIIRAIQTPKRAQGRPV